MAREEAWHWTLRLKTNRKQLIGSISLMRSAEENRGFWLGIPWQGQGLMSEACERVTDYWFNNLGFRVLRAPKAIPNVASRRISEKQGMRVIAAMERNYVGGRFPAELWELTAEEWNRKKGDKNLAISAKRQHFTTFFSSASATITAYPRRLSDMQ